MTWNTTSSAPQDLQKGLVYFYSAVIAYESQFSESVHEYIDSRAGGTDHFRQNLVTWRRKPNS
jgi:hypothetical protein